MITRRKFITSTSAFLAAAAYSPNLISVAADRKLKNFGFISGIIDKEIKDDWKTALKKASSFGYTEIETGGFAGNSADEFLSYLNNIGMRVIAGGFNFTDPDDKIKQSLDLIKKLKADIAVTYWPWFTGGPFTLEDCRKSADRLNHLGDLCYSSGLQFCWHNHNKEFIPMENGLPFDYLMANTDSLRVKCELDVYWVAKGGADPLAVLKKYKGRYLILHIKDMAKGEDKDFECPGSGIIDFRSVFSEADSQGIKHYMVERDNVPDGIACLRSAAEYLSKITF